jgi:hypothetical protein
MSDDRKLLEKMIDNALSGKGAHMATKNLFEGLDWKAAGTRPEAAPHSIFQLLNHLSYWDDWVVKWLDGGSPTIPKHASGSWPGDVSPANAREWQRAVRGSQRARPAGAPVSRGRSPHEARRAHPAGNASGHCRAQQLSRGTDRGAAAIAWQVAASFRRGHVVVRTLCVLPLDLEAGSSRCG